jgi:hypothetical protein
MEKRELDHGLEEPDEQRLLSRRDFLAGLRKWSAAVIGVAVAGAVMAPGEANAAGWVNGRGGGWVNRGGSWVNGGGGGSWYNRGVAWANRGGSWANRAGGGGSWVNRRGW